MSFERILVTTDLSESGNKALRVAGELATTLNAHLTVLYVQESTHSYPDGVLPHKGHRGPVDMVPEITKKLREVASQVGCTPSECAVIHDASPVEGILDHAKSEGVDLIVMATQGRSGLQRLLIGSTTERVVRHAPCAVLTVR